MPTSILFPLLQQQFPQPCILKQKQLVPPATIFRKEVPLETMFDLDLDDFFGDRLRSLPQMASGSGAIISEDGYIVTNNHVIDGADEINVTLSNKRSFKAKLVGADPSSDLAVLRSKRKDCHSCFMAIRMK